MEILDSGITNVTEGSHLIITRFIEGQRVAITVESTAINCTFSYSHNLTGFDVGLETGIHPRLVYGIIHHHSERVPVASVADNDKC